MNKFILLFIGLALASSTHAQITITAADMPVVPDTNNLYSLSTSGVNQPGLGANQNWDYSTVAPTGTTSNIYFPELDTFYTNKGVEKYFTSTRPLNSQFEYYVAYEYDFNSTNVKESGLYVFPQNYELSPLTGSTNDSIKFAEQKLYYPNDPRVFIKFPMTSGNAWVSGGRRAVDFTLDVAAFNLVATPCQIVSHDYRSDSIKAWGKLRVYTANGPSDAYDVLLAKVRTYSTDSFYVAGQPAPQALLTAFQVNQNQRSAERNYYQFYRKGSFQYLLRLFCGADSTMTTLSSAYSHSDNVYPTSIGNTEKTYSTFLYPNPSKNQNIHIQLIGAIPNAEYSCTIYDAMGRVMLNQHIEMTKNEFEVETKDLCAGNYLIKIQDSKNYTIVREQFLKQ